jgi:hypothetical protein
MRVVKRIVRVMVLVLISIYSFAQETPPTSAPVLKVSDSKKSFGFVKQGKEIRIDYEIKNTGLEPLIINEIKIECSCTKAEFPKEPILSGKTGKITLVVDTKTMEGRQDRIVEVISNNKNGNVSLRYKGVVLMN